MKEVIEGYRTWFFAFLCLVALGGMFYLSYQFVTGGKKAVRTYNETVKVFNETSASELVDLSHQGGDSFIYVGLSTCHTCQATAPKVRKGIEKLGVPYSQVYYVPLDRTSRAERKAIVHVIGTNEVPALVHLHNGKVYNHLYPEKATPQKEVDKILKKSGLVNLFE